MYALTAGDGGDTILASCGNLLDMKSYTRGLNKGRCRALVIPPVVNALDHEPDDISTKPPAELVVQSVQSSHLC